MTYFNIVRTGARGDAAIAFAATSTFRRSHMDVGQTQMTSGRVGALLRCLAASVSLSALLAWPTNEAAAQVTYRGGNSNYTVINNCLPIPNPTVTLTVTQDMLANVTGGYYGDGSNAGFSLQLNANPPANSPFQLEQYGIVVQSNAVRGFIQYNDPAGINNNGEPVFLELPSNVITAGTVLKIALTTDGNGNVTSTTLSVIDTSGNVHPLNMPMPTYPNSSTPVLVPIEAMTVSIGGPLYDTDATFTSGAGYFSYASGGGALSVQNSSNPCQNADEAWGTIENSNTSYGYITPGFGQTLVQPFSSPSSGALASNMDGADNQVRVYHFEPSPSGDLEMFSSSGTWTATDVTGADNLPAAAVGSPIIAYEQTIYGAPEAFYLVATTNGGEQIEQLWGSSQSPTALTNAQPAAVGSGLAGYSDPIAVSDNVFFQGTDQHIHLITWSPGAAWGEDTRILNAPVAAFASAITGHMTPESEELFYIGTNQHIYELWRWSKNFDGWHLTDVTAANGMKPIAAIGSPLAGFYDTKAGTDAVFYVGTNQHVYELLFTASLWESIDVTQKSDAPLVGAGTSLAAHLNTQAGSEEVYFVNQNQTIEELWSWSTPTPVWDAYDMFAGRAAQATLANPSSPLAADMDTVNGGLTDELYYIGTDGVVHELWASASSGGWNQATP
jgi:hypothetical protein